MNGIKKNNMQNNSENITWEKKQIKFLNGMLSKKWQTM